MSSWDSTDSNSCAVMARFRFNRRFLRRPSESGACSTGVSPIAMATSDPPRCLLDRDKVGRASCGDTWDVKWGTAGGREGLFLAGEFAGWDSDSKEEVEVWMSPEIIRGMQLRSMEERKDSFLKSNVEAVWHASKQSDETDRGETSWGGGGACCCSCLGGWSRWTRMALTMRLLVGTMLRGDASTTGGGDVASSLGCKERARKHILGSSRKLAVSSLPLLLLLWEKDPVDSRRRMGEEEEEADSKETTSAWSSDFSSPSSLISLNGWVQTWGDHSNGVNFILFGAELVLLVVQTTRIILWETPFLCHKISRCLMFVLGR